MMAVNGAAEATDPSSPARTMEDETLTLDDSDHQFQCCVCLDILFKPVVLACGHIACFWCVHKAMHGLRASHCAICRQPYIHFPGICQLLHLLVLKIDPMAYKRREKEVIEEEKRLDIFSPQFVDNVIPQKVPPDMNDSGCIEQTEKFAENIKASEKIALKESSLPKTGLEDRKHSQLSVSDVLCARCKELLFQPAVLNCGHVYCVSCLSGLSGVPLKCQVCEGLHPGELPNVCLDLDHFLEEQFPREYALRKETVQLEKEQSQHEDPSSRDVQEKQNTEPSFYFKDDDLWLDKEIRDVHVGVGCDSCGMYPIIGKRYKCKDCQEVIGFDLCEGCYNTSSKLPGRFNQQHTPDHRFELDESQMLRRILMRSLEEHDNPDNNTGLE